ncbi:MAG: hypothetical protein ACRDS9_00645 [Pseudonocardiaceae bacterium]
MMTDLGRDAGDVLGHVLPVLAACGLFVAGGLVFWPWGDAGDQLTSRRLRGMAYAASGIGFAPVILAFALNLPTLVTALIATLWLVTSCGLFIAHAIADTREKLEAHARNAALAWPRGRPPLHPGWGLAALMVWGCLEPVLNTDRPGSWITAPASMFGAPRHAVSNAISIAWLVVLLLGVGYTLLMAWRRLRWEYGNGSRDAGKES